ncbi:MAG: RNA polymerase sigma factor [Polyangiaceae bacterium]|nr:RNA polymerase sigma factor [Polyangiaceae bacterium]
MQLAEPQNPVIHSENSQAARLGWHAYGTSLSFSDVFRAHRRFVTGTLRKLGVRSADVEDVGQDVLLAVHRRLGVFTGGSLRSWLYAFCVRGAAAYRRRAWVRRERATPLPELGSLYGGSGEAERGELEGRLARALEGLEQGKRTVFVLHELEEYTLQEVADAVGAPLQTTYSRLQSARRQIRETFVSEDLISVSPLPRRDRFELAQGSAQFSAC